MSAKSARKAARKLYRVLPFENRAASLAARWLAGAADCRATAIRWAALGSAVWRANWLRQAHDCIVESRRAYHGL